MYRMVACCAVLLAAAPAAALTLTGSFTPTPANHVLSLEFGAVNTAGSGNPGDIGPGRHRVSFTLGRPADTELTLQRVTVFDEYDVDGQPLGGDEFAGAVYDRVAFADAGTAFFTIPNRYRVAGPDGGYTDHYFFGDASLLATFSDLGVPVTYSFSVDRIGDVPEPTTWATMILGFAATGIAVRGRREARRGQDSQRAG